MLVIQGLGLAFGASEIGLALVRRSNRARARSHDRGTLGAVWLAVGVSIVAAILVASTVKFGRFELEAWTEGLAIALFALGVGLRWWAIFVLGRFFTVDVAIHEGHQLVRRGPYRVLRHPSYTGSLLTFFGLGLLLQSWPALLVATLPIAAMLMRRIQVEEHALEQHFGAAWTSHSARTWLLVPGVW